MSKASQKLSVEQLAKLFIQLSALESAGLPVFQAFAIITQSEAKLKKPLALMQQQLKAGRPISDAGFKSGIFDDTHKTLIYAAEASGQLTSVYRQLADHYTRLNARIKKVKSRFYVPMLILIVSLFVQPLPAYFNTEISTFDYFRLSLGRLLVIGLGLLLLLHLPAIINSLGIEKAWHRLQLKLPIVANWIIKREVNNFLFILALMLESGLSFADALPKAVASIKNSCLRKQFTPTQKMLATGASVTQTLATVSVINTLILHVLATSELSGKLAGGILHFVKTEAETIGLQDDALAEWIPRFVYILIVIWMAYSISGNHLTTLVSPNLY